MLKNTFLIGGVAAVVLGLSAMSAQARGGGFGGGFHGGGAFHGGGLHAGGIRGYRAGGFRGYHAGGYRHFRGRGLAFYGPYAYGAYSDDDCYWRGRRWVCSYY